MMARNDVKSRNDIKVLLDEQRKILHDRITHLTRFNDESERSNFILDVMTDLPYPDYNAFNCNHGLHDLDFINKVPGKISCKHCKKTFPYG